MEFCGEGIGGANSIAVEEKHLFVLSYSRQGMFLRSGIDGIRIIGDPRHSAEWIALKARDDSENILLISFPARIPNCSADHRPHCGNEKRNSVASSVS